MSDETDIHFLSRYPPNTLKSNPSDKGAYAHILDEQEVLLGEVAESERTRLCVSAFYVEDAQTYQTFRIRRISFKRRSGWQCDGVVKFNRFDVERMRQFISILTAIRPSSDSKLTVSIEQLSLESLASILSSSKANDLIRELSQNPELHQDIIAMAAKRAALRKFEQLLQDEPDEAAWQSFFEHNHWVFGYSLNYIFLDSVGYGLETVTTGSSFDHFGKRVDALMRTRAEVSQSVLIEVKRSDAPLVKRSHRPGCWAASADIQDAVTQIQKTAFDYSQRHFRDYVRNRDGTETGDVLYTVEPRTFLVVGRLSTISDDRDKVSCFELYRRNLIKPEIVTFDELYFRAMGIVERLDDDKDPSFDG